MYTPNLCVFEVNGSKHSCITMDIFFLLLLLLILGGGMDSLSNLIVKYFVWLLKYDTPGLNYFLYEYNPSGTNHLLHSLTKYLQLVMVSHVIDTERSVI